MLINILISRITLFVVQTLKANMIIISKPKAIHA